MTKKQKINELKASLNLRNDARYWDLCRTYGEFSSEVLRHLESCRAYQEEARRA